jgi:hypothetical protein
VLLLTRNVNAAHPQTRTQRKLQANIGSTHFFEKCTPDETSLLYPPPRSNDGPHARASAVLHESKLKTRASTRTLVKVFARGCMRYACLQ